MKPVRDVLARSEAKARAVRLDDLGYDINLDLVAGSKTYRGDVTVSFLDEGEGALFIEFIGGTIERFEVNGADIAPEWDGARIRVAGRHLEQLNTIRVVYENTFDHGGEGFHRFVDPEDGAEYVYTGFEPYQAHRMFPCFDQPDLKATFRLNVTAPSAWEVVSATPVVESTQVPGDRLTRRYAPTLPISTYLFAVVAGPYRSVHDEHRGIPLGIYCRASLFDHLDPDEIFDVTKRGFDFYVEYFGRDYPFSKYDQIFVPEFNWGGMENVGAVTYTEMLVYRDEPTALQRLGRAEILLHELAHMWFGNLVTMEWWNDLWLNESFANFIAFLALDQGTEFEGVWHYFNTRVKSVAYHDDQLPTTHPIADEITTTDETFLNFDQITYGKGASALLQLWVAIGDEAFSRGLQTYFRRHEFGNTTLAEFLAALQAGAADGTDLVHWAARWLRTASVNTLSVTRQEVDGRIRSLRLHQSAPDEHPVVRPHTVEIALVSRASDGRIRVDAVPAVIDAAVALVPGAVGKPAPEMVFPNYRDLTYAKVELDAGSTAFLTENLSRIEDPLFRLLLWSALWEMVRDGSLSSVRFLDLVERHLGTEDNLEIVRVVGLRAVRAVDSYLPEELRHAAGSDLVRIGRAALASAPPGDLRVLWLRTMIRAAAASEDLALVASLVDGDDTLPEVRIDQEMRWDVALRWSAYDLPGAGDRLLREQERDPSDRGLRAALRAEVARPDPDVKAEAWDRLVTREYSSLHQSAAATSGFRWADQRALLAPYVDEFFDRLTPVFDEWEWEEAKQFFLGLYPAYRIEEDTLARSSASLEATSDPRLRRLLLEAIDDMERAIVCRRLAASEAAPVPPEAGEPGGRVSPT